MLGPDLYHTGGSLLHRLSYSSKHSVVKRKRAARVAKVVSLILLMVTFFAPIYDRLVTLFYVTKDFVESTISILPGLLLLGASLWLITQAKMF
jgi:protein-S-isoprenylcysteine O-methyltransferase Ste14